ncbi:cysteine hydrolase [Pseudoduganella ginsengisoli]|uniref:Isochorismatase family protein n=1 Tax=Pseudoduganella ginsengisoli TaxID=1462440 RepID=A0A6L6Q070_9BURK|nr:cysteine hydrolase family protein [Pseudoduganella ginsengisoli]MTW03025.1 isochorismatase family protein [Pseudoduganella ginsengisoli]
MNHPTIRTMVGATAPHTIETARTALLVIDFQNEYFTGKMPIPDGLNALRNTRKLVAHADRHNIPVFHIQHVTPAGSPIFAAGSDSAQQHSELQPAPRHTVLQKSTVSVFQSTGLDARLKAAGVQHVLITGLMTHACVAGAARDAEPLGYSVLVASDACATRDLDMQDGAVLPHAALHRASLAAIADTFGDILATEEILRLPTV